MPLVDTGQRALNPNTMGENAKTIDQDGGIVVVEATSEAIQDYGWPTIIEAASEKYDKGIEDSKGPPPVVRVTTSDCASV